MAELTRFVVGTVIIVYDGSVEAIVARLPPVPGLVRSVRLLSATAG